MPESYRGRHVRGTRHVSPRGGKKPLPKKVLIQTVYAVLILLAVYFIKGTDKLQGVSEQIKLTLNQGISIPAVERFFGIENEAEAPALTEEPEVQQDTKNEDVEGVAEESADEEAIPASEESPGDVIVNL